MALDEISVLVRALGLNTRTEDGRVNKRRGVSSQELEAVVGALGLLDALHQVFELDLAVGVIHAVALTLHLAGSVAIVGEARAAGTPVTLGHVR